jgi:hypothetical protein
MSYRVDNFNGTFLVNVQDGTIDTTTDLRFVGKNYAGYGEVQNENFLHILQNFANTTAPPKAVEGQIWYDSSNEKLKFYDGTKFKAASGAEVSSTAPAGQSIGDLWFDTTADQLYVWSGSEFILVGPETSPDLGTTLFAGQVVKNNVGGNETIGKLIVGDEAIGIISRTEFTLDSSLNPITGFSQIKKGFNLINTNGATGVTTSDHYFWGTTSNTLKLNGFSSDDFVKIGSTTFSSTVAFGDSGLTLGDQNDLKVFVESGDEGIIQNQLGNPVRVRIRITDADIRSPAIFTSTGIIPGTNNFYDLGGSSNTWKNIYASSFNGNLTGNVTGNTTGSHTGNVLASDLSTILDAVNKTVTASFTGTLTGTVIGDVVGTANNALALNSAVADDTATPSTIAIRTASGNLAANQFIGTANQADRMAINDSATDTDPTYRSAKTTATANTVVARNSSADIFANLFQGTATAARYADLAEKYLPDEDYETGTVVMIGGEKEITACRVGARAIGVISENPAFMMNKDLEGGVYVALKGRVPVKTIGQVKKGDKLIAHDNGTAIATNLNTVVTALSTVFAIALEDTDNDGENVIEAVIL